MVGARGTRQGGHSSGGGGRQGRGRGGGSGVLGGVAEMAPRRQCTDEDLYNVMVQQAVPAGPFKRKAGAMLDARYRVVAGVKPGVRQRDLLKEAHDLQELPLEDRKRRAEKLLNTLAEVGDLGGRIGADVMVHWLEHPADCIRMLHMADHEIVELVKRIHVELVRVKEHRLTQNFSTAARFCMWLYRCATTQTFHGIQHWHRTFFNDDSLSVHFLESDLDIMSQAIHSALESYVQFPEGVDLQAQRGSFGSDFPVANVSFCVDATHLPVCSSADADSQKRLYCVHKRIHSIKAQVVVSARGKPLHVDVHGMLPIHVMRQRRFGPAKGVSSFEKRPGSMPDTTQFDSSQLSQLLRRNASTGVLGLGDNGYARRQVLKPTNKHEDRVLEKLGADMRAVKRFNERIATSRVVIEGFYAAMKSAFPIFRHRLEARSNKEVHGRAFAVCVYVKSWLMHHRRMFLRGAHWVGGPPAPQTVWESGLMPHVLSSRGISTKAHEVWSPEGGLSGDDAIEEAQTVQDAENVQDDHPALQRDDDPRRRLSKHEESLIQKFLKKEGADIEHVYVEGADGTRKKLLWGTWPITLESVRRLKPDGLLADDHVNTFMDILNTKFSPGRSAFFFNTYFYANIVKRNSGWNGGSVVRKLKKDLEKGLEIPRKLVFPINLPGHWVCCVVDNEEKAIYYLDSKRGHDGEKEELPQASHPATRIASWYQAQFNAPATSWPIIQGFRGKPEEELPQQGDTQDCGVYTCWFAYYMAGSSNSYFVRGDAPTLRKRLALELLLNAGAEA